MAVRHTEEEKTPMKSFSLGVIKTQVSGKTTQAVTRKITAKWRNFIEENLFPDTAASASLLPEAAPSYFAFCIRII